MQPNLCSVDWFGAPLHRTFPIVFAVSPEHCFIAASFALPLNTMSGTSRGEFVEGLWNFDVVELFLREDGTTRYQELNVAPNGAWWSAVFSDYRKRQDAAPPQGVETHVEVSHGEQLVGFRFPRASLSVQSGFTIASRANLCAVVGTSDSRRYIAFHSRKDSVPDFHLAECMQPMVLR